MTQQASPKVGALAIVPLGDGRAVYAFVVRTNSDAPDFRRCSTCGHEFSYAAIGRNAVDDSLVHLYDCRNAW